MRKTKGRTCKRERYNWPVPETLLGQKRAYTEFRTLIEHRTQLIILRRVGRLLAVPVCLSSTTNYGWVARGSRENTAATHGCPSASRPRHFSRPRLRLCVSLSVSGVAQPRSCSLCVFLPFLLAAFRHRALQVSISCGTLTLVTITRPLSRPPSSIEATRCDGALRVAHRWHWQGKGALALRAQP